MNEESKGLFKQLGKLSLIGIELVVATFIGLAIGLYLDRLFDSAPWLTIAFLIFGIAAGFRNIFREVKKIES